MAKKQWIEPQAKFIELKAGEDNKDAKSDGANTRLPFGLCKKYGIPIQDNWTPRDAWNALKGKTGKSPADFYDNLKDEAKEKVDDKKEVKEVKPMTGEDEDLVEYIETVFQNNNVQSVDVSALQSPLNDAEIIEKVGGYDATQGSCVSQCLAYLGNKAGLDVRDYRGGNSRAIIGKGSFVAKLCDLSSVKSEVETEFNDFVAANKNLAKVENGKEYLFTAGGHAAIVKRDDEGLKYLELQSEAYNGFHILTTEILKYRFACKKSHTSYYTKYKKRSFLVETSTLIDNGGFEKILQYLNTQNGRE